MSAQGHFVSRLVVLGVAGVIGAAATRLASADPMPSPRLTSAGSGAAAPATVRTSSTGLGSGVSGESAPAVKESRGSAVILPKDPDAKEPKEALTFGDCIQKSVDINKNNEANENGRRDDIYYVTVKLHNKTSAPISFKPGEPMAHFTGPTGAGSINNWSYRVASQDLAAPAGGMYLAPGASTELQTTLGRLSGGEYDLAWEGDPKNLYTPASMPKSKHCKLKVDGPTQPGALPDLTVSDIVINPTSGTHSTAFVFTISVTNAGHAPTVAGSIAQIPSCLIDGLPLVGGAVQNASSDPIQPANSLTYVRTRTPGVTPGTHSVTCSTDSHQLLAEENENNNSLTKQFSVQP
jgi:hypothetical protein